MYNKVVTLIHNSFNMLFGTIVDLIYVINKLTAPTTTTTILYIYI